MAWSAAEFVLLFLCLRFHFSWSYVGCPFPFSGSVLTWHFLKVLLFIIPHAQSSILLESPACYAFPPYSLALTASIFELYLLLSTPTFKCNLHEDSENQGIASLFTDVVESSEQCLAHLIHWIYMCGLNE